MPSRNSLTRFTRRASNRALSSRSCIRLSSFRLTRRRASASNPAWSPYFPVGHLLRELGKSDASQNEPGGSRTPRKHDPYLHLALQVELHRRPRRPLRVVTLQPPQWQQVIVGHQVLLLGIRLGDEGDILQNTLCDTSPSESSSSAPLEEQSVGTIGCIRQPQPHQPRIRTALDAAIAAPCDTTRIRAHQMPHISRCTAPQYRTLCIDLQRKTDPTRGGRTPHDWPAAPVPPRQLESSSAALAPSGAHRACRPLHQE